MPSQAQKATARLAARIAGHIESVKADSVGSGKGYRQPGSLNRHKSLPIGERKSKKR